MNTMRLTDNTIRAALEIDPEISAPFDLSSDIRAAIETTPQRRAPWWVRSRRGRLVALGLVLALLVLALAATIIVVGSMTSRPGPLSSILSFHGGPARTGVMPGPGPSGTPVRCWPAVALTGPASTFVEPAVADGTIYAADASGTVSAIAEATGRLIWRNSGHLRPINSSPALSGAVIVVGSDDGNLSALDRATGSLLWAVPTGGPLRSPPTIVDGVAYFGSDDGRLYAIDVATHAQRWAPVQTGGPVDRAVSTADGLIFAGSGGATNATVDAYDLRTGRPVWSAPQPAGPGQVSTSSVDGGRVFVAGGLDARGAHRLYAFDEHTGALVWPTPFATPSGADVFVGAVSSGVVYAVSFDHAVYALDAATGKPVWSRPFVTGGRNGSVGAVADGTLYVAADDGWLYAIDATAGTERWRFRVGGGSAAPSVIDGRVILATSLGQVVCVTGSAGPSATDG